MNRLDENGGDLGAPFSVSLCVGVATVPTFDDQCSGNVGTMFRREIATNGIGNIEVSVYVDYDHVELDQVDD